MRSSHPIACSCTVAQTSRGMRALRLDTFLHTATTYSLYGGPVVLHIWWGYLRGHGYMGTVSAGALASEYPVGPACDFGLLLDS